ncbi:MAG: glycoside hydrolase family 3 N-terminal domain-containing protein [Pseudomonadota bacterium]
MSERPAYRDPERGVDARVKDLLGRMTLDEKLAQLGGVRAADVWDAGFDAQAASTLLAHGIGHVARPGVGTGATPQATARFVDAAQRFLREHTRLGIPALFHEEAPAGYCAAGATRFPQSIGQAATWDTAGVRAMAAAVAAEMRAVGVRQAIAPVLDIARDPRWGRLEETFGEDPYLAGRLGVAWIRGLQSGSAAERVVATARHFVGAGVPEGGLNQAPVQLGSRELREVHVAPFAAAVGEAGLEAVMCGSSAVDGVPPAASSELLGGLLRDELGFRGVVVSDYDGVGDLVRHHRVARDEGHAAAQALAAGVDVETPALACFGEPLKALVEAGKVEPSLVDGAVSRVLRSKFELGLFDVPEAGEQRVADAFRTADSRHLARRLAEQSMVLLKNDGILPLGPGCRLAVLGPAADDPRLLLGDYHYAAQAEVACHETPARDLPAATPRRVLETRMAVEYRRGCALTGDASGEMAAAVAAARNADAAVVFVGGRSGSRPDCTSGEHRDASDLRLTGAQGRLVREVAATGTPVVMVVIGGRAFTLEAETAAVNAALMAWLPGEEGAAALARLLLGDVSPSGRLPVSLPRSAGQIPVHYDHRAGGGRSAELGDYTDGSTRPVFPFGHGLSYAAFEYDDLVLPDTVDAHAALNVWLSVRNVSERDGDEIVQLYVRPTIAGVAPPVRKLVGFVRVPLPAGAARRLRFQVDTSQLGHYDRGKRLVVQPGEVTLLVGASARDVRLRGTVTVRGEPRPLQPRQVLATQVEVTDVRA